MILVYLIIMGYIKVDSNIEVWEREEKLVWFIDSGSVNDVDVFKSYFVNIRKI